MTSAKTKFKADLVALMSALPDYLLNLIEQYPGVFASEFGFTSDDEFLPSGRAFKFKDFDYAEVGNATTFLICKDGAPSVPGEYFELYVAPALSGDCSALDDFEVRDVGTLIQLSCALLTELEILERPENADVYYRVFWDKAPAGLDPAVTIRTAVSVARIKRTIDGHVERAHVAIANAARAAREQIAA